MRALTRILTAAAAAVSLAAIAAPSQATVFAQYSPDSNAAIYRWVNNGANNSGTGGQLYTTATGTATVPGAANVHFSFLDPSLSSLMFVPAKFTLNATVASGNPAAFAVGPNTWTQTNLNGGFSFIYTGASHTFGSIFVAHNANLLSGTFTDAWIQGAGGTGSTNLSATNGGSMTFTSDFEQFLNLDAGTEEFAMNLLSVNPAFGALPGKALKSFRANGGGNFNFETAMVPEPATWGLMLVGFGGVGALLRHRRRQGVAFA
ncbi:MAG: hypothetical protein JWQ29_341 [Phenylobacterium sp.]|nr:hypothetical protein [Phenylobacterium sp.]